MQSTKSERTMQLIRSVLATRLPFIRSFADSQPGQRKEIDFRLPSGARARISFVRLEDLTLIATGDFDAMPMEARVGFGLVLDGEIKMEAQFSPAGLDLVAYTPGSWERGVGLSNDSDREVLLPPALRNHR